MSAYYCVRSTDGVVVARDLTVVQAQEMAASTGGTAAIDETSLAYLDGMASAAYGCGATLMGDSYAASARAIREGERG